MSWKAVEFTDEFVVEVPEDTTLALERDRTTFVVRLAGEPPTEILISRHPLPEGIAGQPEALIRSALEGMCRGGVPGAAEGGAGFMIEPLKRNGALAAQGTGRNGRDRWWLARAVQAGTDYFLLVWAGPEEDLRRVVRDVFESFTPLVRPTP